MINSIAIRQVNFENWKDSSPRELCILNLLSMFHGYLSILYFILAYVGSRMKVIGLLGMNM